MTNWKNLKITLAVSAVAITSVLILSSWDFKNNNAAWNDYGYNEYDTVPKKEKKIRDLDDVIDEMNGVDLKDLKIDMEKMQRELKESMKQFDAQKMQLEMEKAMRDVDFQKMQKEIEQSMSKVDIEKIQKEMAQAIKGFDAMKLQKEMEQAMKGFDAAKLQKELQESMQKMEWDKMQNEFNRVKDIDFKKMQLEMEKVQSEMGKIGPEIEKSMEKAKVEIEKAKEEMKEYKEFVDGLDKDGLINKKEEYTIKHNNGELFINGKKASDATYNKYKNFLEKHKKFTIEKSDDDFNIDVD